jgi:glycerophosphoryl diester phosphodiesterase
MTIPPMPPIRIEHCLIALLAFMTGSIVLNAADSRASASDKVIIAHRGASGYLPEHTLEAKAMAHAFGADYIEQDLVLTKDDVPVVLHDITLEAVTDVEQVFPDRKRPDGKYYAVDFTLAEIKTLNVHERIDTKSGKQAFPKRFPASQGTFRVPTFEEELQLIQGLNASRGTSIGIYPELKSPAFHRAEGKDLAAVVLPILKRYGYWEKSSACHVQCFEWPEIARVRAMGYPGKLVFLVGRDQVKLDESGPPVPLDETALAEIARTADGLGPALSLVVEESSAGEFRPTGLVEKAHAAGLVVHPYTIRTDVPFGKAGLGGAETFELILKTADADGVFTDQADAGAAWKRNR